MGVAAAFPSVARGSLLRKMRVMGIDENLVDWTTVSCVPQGHMSVNGQDDDPRTVTTASHRAPRSGGRRQTKGTDLLLGMTHFPVNHVTRRFNKYWDIQWGH